MKDKIEATRQKASDIIVEIIKNSNKDWCDSTLVPKLLQMKN